MKRSNIAYACFGLNCGTCVYKRNKITAGKDSSDSTMCPAPLTVRNVKSFISY